MMHQRLRRPGVLEGGDETDPTIEEPFRCGTETGATLRAQGARGETVTDQTNHLAFNSGTR
jgi:hypothetical protein